jgi:5-methylcytosine-specific restriction endonuclease McrA
MLPEQESKNDIVFVIDKDKKPLLPTCSARGRLLLKKGKAKLVSAVPFTIQLHYPIKNIKGEFNVGIDDGSKEVGIAIINEFKNEVVFRGSIRLRQDISRKILQKSMYRRSRRSRKLRGRIARFDNRKPYTPFPSIKYRKDTIDRVLNDIGKKINITKCVVEQGSFDTSSMARDKKLKGKEYQESEFEGKNRRAKILWRDRYTCQKCKSKDILQVHHIIQRSKGGTDTLQNLLTLCESCHKDLHEGKFTIDKKVKIFQYPQYLQQGKWYLLDLLKRKYEDVKVCFGWQTSYWREKLDLEKTHYNDAISMVCEDRLPKIKGVNYLVIPKRKKVWGNNPTKTCEEKNGFRHYDLVKSIRSKVGVIGSIRSLAEKVITLRTKFDDNFAVSYKKTKLLQRFKSIIYA